MSICQEPVREYISYGYPDGTIVMVINPLYRLARQDHERNLHVPTTSGWVKVPPNWATRQRVFYE